MLALRIEITRWIKDSSLAEQNARLEGLQAWVATPALTAGLPSAQ
jgi:hypothetical protein